LGRASDDGRFMPDLKPPYNLFQRWRDALLNVLLL
jgi:hypothetical protein